MKSSVRTKRLTRTQVNSPETVEVAGESKRRKKMEKKKSSDNGEQQNRRAPLAKVVSDCLSRWFQDTLKEAKAGDVSMQVLVGQMYLSGYGVPRDTQKGRLWVTRAARVRSSVWSVSNKRPGYNASDSDSEELEGDS
ncbi:uncharacterized protein LOC132284381 [Cornus florida]|uniref:uncharacterized protein LOC132284381 n=1 Tax=Cornus florida TaxID=4283 RepID=UPI00289A8B8C|nr:uncharacterized protein LOC132284381 [Cornus florida]